MKKRLRKKHHLAEFAEWGRQIFVQRNRKDGFDEFLYEFVRDAVNANGCQCAGGGSEDQLDVVVELGRLADDPDAKLGRITAWLEARPDVESWQVGELFDLWYDDFEAIISASSES